MHIRRFEPHWISASQHLVLPTRFAKLAEPCLKLETVNRNITVFILSCCLYKRYFVYSANGQIQANMQSRR